VEFEWDRAKAASNLAKHRIDFADAVGVFDDPHRLDRVDTRSRGEPRFQTIGMVSDIVIFVSYTMRAQICRIISARRANRRERRAYSLQTRH
jgi:uncharacterized DUF497 family protein